MRQRDALEALGIALDENPASVAEMVRRRNFAFLFAPHFHPAFRNIGPLRKELGVRTLFNILGPMINPARPSHLLMGVAVRNWCPWWRKPCFSRRSTGPPWSAARAATMS